MKGYITIYEIYTYTDHNNQILSEISFSIYYEDGQTISTKIIMSAFRTSHNEMVEKIKEYFKGDLYYKY